MSVFTHYKKQTLSIASRNVDFMGILGGKTIGEIGQAHGLDGSEFEFEEKEVKGLNIRNLYLSLDGKEWQIGISRGFNWDKRHDAEWLMNCEFYRTFVAVKNAEGVVEMDDNNRPVLMDGNDGRELREQIILGNPSGLTKGNNVEKAFAAEADETTAKRNANKALA